jgi:hypothetical protein
LPRLRLSLTIPGAVALGAYEAGALAALVVAAKELGEDVLVIDSIASASAGSVTGLLAARSLLSGIDPIELLSSEAVGNGSRTPSAPSSRRQKEPIRLSLALAVPSGPTCAPDLMRDADWYILTLTNTMSPQEYVAYADAALAAGSAAEGSPVNTRDLLAEERGSEAPGLLTLPEDGLFWYTDGGTVDNEPLNRTIELADDIGSDDERLYLVINPDPAFPTRSLSNDWGADAKPPHGAFDFAMRNAPSIYEELERAHGTSAQLELIGTPVAAVDAARTRCDLNAALVEAQEAVRRRQETIAGAASRILAEREAGHSDDYASLLAAVVHSDGARRQVPVEVISPAIDPSVADPPSQQLAGAFLNCFGGLFDISLCQSDFCLGYRNMGYWIEHRLNSYLPHHDVSGALASVEQDYERIGWSHCCHGEAPFAAPSFRNETELRALALHAGRAIAHDLNSEEP